MSILSFSNLLLHKAPGLMESVGNVRRIRNPISYASIVAYTGVSIALNRFMIPRVFFKIFGYFHIFDSREAG